jgi:solute carrier family 25 phosphate transporter 23/24/25/41
MTLGTVSQTLTYPFDVLRRKMQVTGMKGGAVKYSGALDALRSILRVEGVAGLYRGLWPNLRESRVINFDCQVVLTRWVAVKVAPSIATSFFTYELVSVSMVPLVDG